MKKSTRLAAPAIAIALLALAGCASTATPSTAGSSSAGSSDSSTPASSNVLATATTSLGSIVVDGKGMTVYYYTKDVKDSGKSTCSGGCLALWPAVVAPSSSPKVDGVTGTIGSITRDDGTAQVTINGLPVYTYAQDSAAGDVNGQSVGGVWYVVSPNGDINKGGAKSGY